METKMKKILVCGAGGFIGFHLVNKLVEQGHYVIGADIKQPAFEPTKAQEFFQVDLRNPDFVAGCVKTDLDEVYHLGMMVDNGIVVVENVYRLMEKEGLNRIEATKKGISEIAFPIIISTATTIAALTILIVKSLVRIQQSLIQNTDGKNCLVKDCI